MGRKKIEGTTHIRRKLDKRTKIAAAAISVIAALVSIFLFITKTEMGKGIQEKVSQATTAVSEYRLPFASGSGGSPTSEVQSIIRVVGEVQRDGAGELKGYVSGGGTLSKGESMTLEATPFPGYVFDKWKVGGTDISSSNSITVGYSCTECNYNATGNVNIEALFKKQSDSVTYTVKLLPQIGRFSLKAAPYVGDDVNYQDVKNELNIVVNGSDNQFKRTFLYWQMTYSDLEQWFPSTSVNHSEGSNSTSGSNTSDTHTSDDGHDSHTEGTNNSSGTNESDSYISSKTYTIAYDVYVFNKDGKVVWTYSDIAEKQEVNYPIDDPSAYIDINPYLHSYVADISDDASRSIFGEDCTILLAPHIEDGWEHAIITKADPQDGGLTTGDKVSSTMFASTITAMPSENYLFDHWSWTDNADGNRAMSSKDSSITVSPKGVVEYTAHFVPENYTIDLESCLPEDGGTISGLGTYAAHKDVDIQITPQPGYKIDSWNYTTKDGKRFSGTSERFTINDLTSDVSISVKFTNGKSRIEVKASPIEGGNVTVRNATINPTDGIGEKPDYEEFVLGQEDAVLKAVVSNTDYVFAYWEDSEGRQYDGEIQSDGKTNILMIKNVASSEKFTAHFIKKALSVDVKVEPNTLASTRYEAGEVDVTYTNTDDLTKTLTFYRPDIEPLNDIKAQTNVIIKAKENSGYHFVKFVDDKGKTYTDNPTVIVNVTDNLNLTAIYTPDEFDINAIASPVTGGKVTVNGRDGSNTVSYNDEVTLVAKPKAEFDFRYFEDQNGNKYSGTVNASGEAELSFFAVNGAETYKAVFALKEVSVSVKVDPNTKTGGKYNAGGYRVDYTDPSGSAASSGALYEEKKIEHIKGQTSVKITAIEGDGYHFSKFIDSEGNTWNDNPMVLGDLVENKSIEVIYVPDKFTISAQASPSTGGTVDVQVNHNGDITKREGSNTVAYNDEVTLIAKPKTGFGFRYFEDQNGNKYSGTIKNPGTASETYEMSFKAVNGSETYKAVFAFDKVKVTVKVDPNTLKNSKYAAGYGEVTYTDIVSGESVTKTVDYDDSTIDDIKGQTSVKINAIARTGYHFSKFIDSEGNTWTENPMVLGDLVENKDIEIIFVPDEFTIEAKALPVTGGVVTVNGREGSNTVKYDDEITLIATPKSANFEFRYFEDQYGNQYKKDLVDPVTGIAVFKFKAVNGSETYKAIFAMKDITYNISVDPDTMADGKYVAGGYEITYKKQDGTEETLTRYEKAAISGIKGQTDVKIRALEKDGYHFERFIDSKGQSHTENPLIVHDVVENEDITIIFVEDELTVNVVVTPDRGGTATANGKAGTSKVKYGEMVSVVAKANSGYMFRYFEDQDGNHYEGITNADGSHTYSFKAVNASTTYKAVFVMQTIELEMIYDPNDMSKSGAIVTYQSLRGEQIVTDPTRNQINDIVGMTDIKIKAVEKSGYKFAKFVDGTGKVYTDNPLILPNVTENQKITVIFVEEHWRIEVKSYPEAGGRVLANGIEGGIDADYGDNIKLEAKANEGYTFKYFRDSAGNDYLSNPLEFEAINGNETYTAYFAKNSVTVTIDLTPKGYGTVRFNSEPAVSTRTTYPAEGLSNVTLTAQSKTETQFVCWRDQDGNSYTDNPLTIVDISTDLIFTAVFEGETTGVRAIASPPSGGKIRKIINDDGSITLIATANRGYTFTHWKKPNGMTLASKFTIPANQVKVGDTYIAYFKYNKNYDAKSDITKESFYREWRKVVTPNYTVTRDSMKLLAMQTVSGLRQYDDATPPLKNYQAVSNAQAYFDAKLAEEIKRLDGLFGDAELMTAEAEELTPDMLPDINKYQTIAEDFTAKKFGHLYETEILTVKKVIEPQNFDNRKRTYLWRYTGAEFKENIYLLYDINDKKPKWVSPIVDMDGVLKFTIDELKDKDVVAVVRVKIKQ